MWGLWSETQARWYAVGGVVLCTPYRQIIRAQVLVIKALDPDDYMSMCWVATAIGAALGAAAVAIRRALAAVGIEPPHGLVDLTLHARSVELTVDGRSVDLTLEDR